MKFQKLLIVFVGCFCIIVSAVVGYDMGKVVGKEECGKRLKEQLADSKLSCDIHIQTATIKEYKRCIENDVICLEKESERTLEENEVLRLIAGAMRRSREKADEDIPSERK
jgi:bifunctional ADP-heptose synthase (sugar kinase/adenylyltransferase)